MSKSEVLDKIADGYPSKISNFVLENGGFSGASLSFYTGIGKLLLRAFKNDDKKFADAIFDGLKDKQSKKEFWDILTRDMDHSRISMLKRYMKHLGDAIMARDVFNLLVRLEDIGIFQEAMDLFVKSLYFEVSDKMLLSYVEIVKDMYTDLLSDYTEPLRIKKRAFYHMGQYFGKERVKEAIRIAYGGSATIRDDVESAIQKKLGLAVDTSDAINIRRFQRAQEMVKAVDDFK
jgi:hypothetical protein